MIIAGAPRNSAAANCQPMSTIMMSSITRFVDASWKTIAAVKFAPLRKMDRACATAAYEHEDDAIPNKAATVRVFGESSGSSYFISDFETTA